VLRLAAEHVVAVPPLALPEAPGATPDDLRASEAVRLFAARAGAADGDFAVTAETAGAVAEVCVRLDGLPLAIELAAARVRLLPPAALLARLGRRLPVLTGGARDAPARQQTLHATIAWSHDLLPPAEQTLFRRLAVFAGGCTLAAAEVVCAGSPGDMADAPVDVLAGVGALLDKSLVQHRETTSDPTAPRLAMLETIREFALERLDAAAEAEALRERHARFYLALAEAAAPELRGPGQVPWLDRLEAEHANLRQALDWWEARGAAAEGLRLASALNGFWHWRGHPGEGRARLAAWLARPAPPGGEAARAEALRMAGALAYLQGDHAAARPHLEASAALRRALGDRRGLARSLTTLTLVALREDDPAARALAEEAVACARAAGDRAALAHALHALGPAVRRTDPGAARAALEESLALFPDLGAPFMYSSLLNGLANLDRAAGAPAAARRRYEAALAIRREHVDQRGLAVVLHNLGILGLLEGDAPQAAAQLREGLALFRAVGSVRGLESVDRMVHLYGSDDLEQKLPAIFLPSRWRLARRSFWNRAVADGRLRLVLLPGMAHTGPGGYLDPDRSGPDGRSFLGVTAAEMLAVIRSSAAAGPDPSGWSAAVSPSGAP
jgi:predicted ATPase